MKTWTAGEKVLADDINSNFKEVTQEVFVAGQDLSDGDAVVFSLGGSTTIDAGASAETANNTNDWRMQTMLITKGDTINGFDVKVRNSGNANVSITVKRTSGGLPTGSALATGSYTTTNTDTNVVKTITLSTAIDVDVGELIAIIFEQTSGSGTYKALPTYGGTGYTDGVLYTSSDGSSWSAGPGGDAEITLDMDWPDAGKIVKSSALADDFRANGWLGFVIGATSRGDDAQVQFTDFFETTGLTAGSVYYLSDTDGEISSSAGTQTRKVGLAVSTTKLLIIREYI
jgi:hypothetical protein